MLSVWMVKVKPEAEGVGEYPVVIVRAISEEVALDNALEAIQKLYPSAKDEDFKVIELLPSTGDMRVILDPSSTLM